MFKDVISTTEAPEYPTYSRAVKAGHTVYVAGTTGVDVTTGEFAGLPAGPARLPWREPSS